MRKHNEEVDKLTVSNSAAHLNWLDNETDNPGIFRGLVEFVASLDTALEEHLNTATILKGTSKTVQNKLLDFMLSVLKDCILDEVHNADYLTHWQLVLVLLYIDSYNSIREEIHPTSNAMQTS